MGRSVFLFKKLRRRRVDLFFISKSYAEDESICFLFQKVTQKMSRSVFYFKKLRRRRVKLFFISKTYAVSHNKIGRASCRERQAAIMLVDEYRRTDAM